MRTSIIAQVKIHLDESERYETTTDKGHRFTVESVSFATQKDLVHVWISGRGISPHGEGLSIHRSEIIKATDLPGLVFMQLDFVNKTLLGAEELSVTGELPS